MAQLAGDVTELRPALSQSVQDAVSIQVSRMSETKLCKDLTTRTHTVVLPNP
jgi:hypothetical protein